MIHFLILVMPIVIAALVVGIKWIFDMDSDKWMSWKDALIFKNVAAMVYICLYYNTEGFKAVLSEYRLNVIAVVTGWILFDIAVILKKKEKVMKR